MQIAKMICSSWRIQYNDYTVIHISVLSFWVWVNAPWRSESTLHETSTTSTQQQPLKFEVIWLFVSPFIIPNVTVAMSESVWSIFGSVCTVHSSLSRCQTKVLFYSVIQHKHFLFKLKWLLAFKMEGPKSIWGSSKFSFSNITQGNAPGSLSKLEVMLRSSFFFVFFLIKILLKESNPSKFKLQFWCVFLRFLHNMVQNFCLC